MFEITLHAIEGPYGGKSAVLKQHRLTIGRDHTCNIPLPDDPLVSRKHARIYSDNGKWFIIDAGSTNGTFVNTDRLSSHPALLLDGAVIDKL